MAVGVAARPFLPAPERGPVLLRALRLANRPRAWSVGGISLEPREQTTFEVDQSPQGQELIEIGIPGADPSDPVFAHENSRMRIVEQIAGEVRQLQNDLFGDVGASLRRDRTASPARREAPLRTPTLPAAPRPSHARGWVVTRRNS